MRDLSTLYDAKVTGVFPEVKAKSATSPTAKDGSPYKAINIDDLQFGWLQALFYKLGATPNGVPEVFDTSQIVDLLTNLASFREPETITSGGALDPAGFSRLYNLDGSLGIFTVELADGTFNGQVVELYCDEATTGNLFYKGTGIYDGAGSTGTPLSPGYKIRLVWSTLAARWTYENVITADYVSGGLSVDIWSSGIHEESGVISNTTINLSSAYYGSGSANTYLIDTSVAFALSFVSISDKIYASPKSGARTCEIVDVSTTDITIRGATPANSTPFEIYWTVKGKY